ncbi:MAG TPA: DUF3800 domain-containing protein [Bacillota bacterium]|jgi:hypothetical protein|nr:DUF3800 domain-containing protein [Bacillota bacterium]
MPDALAGIGKDECPVPGHRNYLIHCDESGINGHRYYGFGSLWMPYERRGDFAALIHGIKRKHRTNDEIKWNLVKNGNHALYIDLVQQFFRRTWLMFHCLIVRPGLVDMRHHKDRDEAKRKHFALLIQKKIEWFSNGAPDKSYMVRVDPLPSRYRKADEAAFKIVGATLKKELGISPLKSVTTHDSKEAPGIQLADLLLGATLSDWQGKPVNEGKQAVRKLVADHVGWPDMFGDTWPTAWKFNIWYFHDPASGAREVKTRSVRLKIPMPVFRRR